MKVKTLTLKQIDLSKAEKHECPGIETGKRKYLVQIKGDLWFGSFSRPHYGLCFYGWYNTHIQFDAPGSNHSNWEGVWEIAKCLK